MIVQPGLALIFDMDGVVLDSNPVHREAWAAYNRRFGIETDEAMHQRMYGKRNDEIVRDFFGPGLTVPEVAMHGAAKESLFREMIGSRLSQTLVPGLAEMLQSAGETPLGLATNAETANVDFVLDGALVGGIPLRRYFRAIVDGHQVSRPKPHPEIYVQTAGLLGVDPRNSVVFEDSFAGIEAARAAGARVVGLRTTHREFKNIALSVDDFQDLELKLWLEAQKPLC